MTTPPPHLRTVMRDVSEIDTALTAEMYHLFESHYDAVSTDRFMSDLAAKDRALLLFAPDGSLAGFTLMRVAHITDPFSCTVIYSGDTVIHQAWWGRNDGILAFFQAAGQIAATIPRQPLYWAVIFNGYRTWRIMPSGFHVYWPHPEYAMPAQVAELRDELGSLWFGSSYDRTNGLVRFPQSIGHLKSDLGAVPERLKRNRNIQFFVETNPGYLKGDELFCLAEFKPSNLRPLARKRFELGAQEGNLYPA